MNSGEAILRLVQTAAAQNSLDGISELLRVVTESMESWGTLLWLPVPGSDAEAGKGRLVVLAYWIPPEAAETLQVWHDLPFDSMTGHVLQKRRAGKATFGDDRIDTPTSRFIEASGSRHFCLAPMKMTDGSDAVLGVYRREDRGFDDEDVAVLVQLAAVLPALYSTVTDRVGFSLLDSISEIRRAADEATVSGRLKLIVDKIFRVFPCLEVSLFLNGIDDEPGVYILSAYRTRWEGPWNEKTQYKAGEGATGYVIKTGKTVRIVDLRRYEEDIEWIRSQYPGMQWVNSLSIRDRADDHFKTTDPEAGPPLSLLCVPIRGEKRILGAIRLSVSTQSPYYFDGWQAKFVEMVAVRIGDWWQESVRAQQKDREILAWDRLMNGLDSMNKFVLRQLKRRWDEPAFFVEAMRLAHVVIPHTDNSDVRMIEDDALVTKAVCGKDWDQYPQAKQAKYSIPDGSTASYLIANTKKGVTIYDNADEAPRLKRIFPDTRKFLLAPIEAGDSIYGVLIVRSKSPRPFPPNTKLIAAILGQQLGLYHSLILQIRDLQSEKKTHRLLIDTQARTIDDVHHQVKSPIISAHRAAASLIAHRMLPGPLRPNVEVIRGLCGKVERVVRNMGMFSDLANDRAVRLSKVQLSREVLLRMLREACVDHQSLTDPERWIDFHLEEKSLAELAGRDKVGELVEADIPLIEQCVNNLLDNAAKYSFNQTIVRVGCGIQARGTEFYIAVTNEGFAVKPEDAGKLKKRGYRSERAVRASGEGSGIGLWIVDEIMRAHCGRLSITPTQNGINDFRLVFPIVKGIGRLALTS